MNELEKIIVTHIFAFRYCFPSLLVASLFAACFLFAIHQVHRFKVKTDVC